MSGKSTFVLFVLISITCSLYGQDSKYQRLYPFDNEKFKERLKEYNSLVLDTVPNLEEALASNINNKYAMKWHKVEEDEMAPMPNMQIKKDVNYHMQIKKYELQYPYVKPDRIEKLLENKDLKVPMKKR